MVVGDGVLIKCDPSVSGGKVVIPEGVKSISGGTFANMAISEIEFPNTLTYIGDEAFLCTDIRDLEFPDSLKKIGKRAFGTVEEKYNQDAIYTYYCYQSEIETIKFGSSLEIIDDGAFLGLSSCSELEFPDSLKEIGDQAFMAERIEMNEFQRRSKREEDNTLKTIVFGNSIEKIGAEAFEDKAAVKNVTIPKSVTSLAESAFNEATTVIKESEEKEPEFIILDTPDEAGFCIDANGLLWNYTSYDKSEVVVPDTVKVIGDNAGTENGSIKSLVISENVEYIEANAFSGCKNLSSITIPDSVIAVRNNAFDETPWI